MCFEYALDPPAHFCSGHCVLNLYFLLRVQNFPMPSPCGLGEDDSSFGSRSGLVT